MDERIKKLLEEASKEGLESGQCVYISTAFLKRRLDRVDDLKAKLEEKERECERMRAFIGTAMASLRTYGHHPLIEYEASKF